MAVVVASTAALTAAIAASSAAMSARVASGHPMPIWASLIIIACYGSVIVFAAAVGLFFVGRWIGKRCNGAWERWCTRA